MTAGFAPLSAAVSLSVIAACPVFAPESNLRLAAPLFLSPVAARISPLLGAEKAGGQRGA